MGQIYKAHINEDTNEIQTVKEHLENTAVLCRQFSIPAMKDILYIMGLLHDIGKYQDIFQQRINGKNIRVEHSGCGAAVADKLYPNTIGLIMGYCIAGHHSGIPDGGDGEQALNGRLKREFEDFSAYKEELDIDTKKIDKEQFGRFLIQDCNNDMNKLIDKFAFLTRYSFSCLTDADTFDTARFCGTLPGRQLKADFENCLKKVDARLSSFECETQLQKSRMVLQNQVFSKKNKDAEIYLMNMPTGSGKTLCSVKFALERVIKGNKKRIIYIIPYNSIVDQTADIFDKLFGDDAEILRHQSTYSYEDSGNNKNSSDNDEDYRQIMKTAAENWDAGFIITTAVQFFESVYSNKRSKLRKLHNMSDSLLVFDEAHLMPSKYLQPCLQAITYITRYLNSEAVFLTATMPDFPKLIKQYVMEGVRIENLVEDTRHFDSFQKCRYIFSGTMDEEQILEKALQYPTSLIIVNKRATAAKIYKACTMENKYHLSTYMTAYDRKRVLDGIREKLSALENDYPGLSGVPEERRIVIVSTSLIEAGVDLDIYTVFRELTGLDSILQAGGRCNREGRREKGDVFIFSYKESSPVSQDGRENITRPLLKKYNDISCPESIKEYYDTLFFLKKSEMENNTTSSICNGLYSIPFREYADSFEIIDSKTVSVAVERDDISRDLIRNVKFAGIENIRKLQQYTCSVYQYELEELLSQKAVDNFGTGVWCLVNDDYYDENTGITFEAKDHFV